MNDLERVPKEIFEELGISLGEKTLNFFVRAGMPSIEKELTAWSNAISSLLMARILEKSLKDHAQALSRATEASEKHARELVTATKALVAATIALAIVAIIALFN